MYCLRNLTKKRESRVEDFLKHLILGNILDNLNSRNIPFFACFIEWTNQMSSGKKFVFKLQSDFTLPG